MEQASIETVICFPHNQFRFKYRINDGSFHFIDKYEAFKFFLQYLPNDNSKMSTLRELLHSFLPFLIIPKTGDIFELKKQTNTESLQISLHELTDSSLSNIKQYIEDNKDKEKSPNDNLKNEIEKRVLK